MTEGRALVESILERATDMKHIPKYILISSILAAMLGGCVIVPAGHGDNRDGYYGERDYNRGDGNYRGRGNRGDGNYRDYNYRGDQGSQGNPYRDHGG